MALDVILVVLAAAVLHAAWNAMAKGRQGSDPLVGAMVIAAGAAVVSVVLLLVSGLPAPPSYPYAVASGIIHVGYFVLLGLSYRYADYSAVYPLTRGTAPLFTAALGTTFVGEPLSALMLAGVVALGTGVIGMSLHGLLRGGIDRRALAVAAANICVIVAYTLIDGLGVRLSGNPAGYVAAMMLLTGVLLGIVVGACRGHEMREGLRSHWRLGLVGGTMVMASYGAALWAMTRAPIGAVAALRETSVLFGALIAATLMGERFGGARIAATVLIFAGLMGLRFG